MSVIDRQRESKPLPLSTVSFALWTPPDVFFSVASSILFCFKGAFEL